jgi:hypothetical protein
LRLALLNTPRSGSTWLRCLLATTFQLEEFSAFGPEEVDWNALPRRGVVHLHARRTLAMRDLLSRYHIRPVVVSRHPLDVLISILHFAPHEPDTARWLNGEAGDEKLLYHATPTSDTFMEYATSPRAKVLLSVSPAWATARDALVVSYEQLVAAPVDGLIRIANELGEATVRDPREAIEMHSLARHRAASRNQHYWRGQPGIWRRLLTAQIADEIADAQWPAFSAFGYVCDADPQLTAAAAEQNWQVLCAACSPGDFQMVKNEPDRVSNCVLQF